MYESRHAPLLPRRRFLRRLLHHLLVALVLIGGSLVGGMIGYRALERLTWIDAFLNASMLLGGMGPVNPPQSSGGKLFAGFYALYAGLLFIAITGLLIAPVLHRVVHRFHLEGDTGHGA